MGREESSSEGWFYKRAGETFGPVSAERLQELLAAGLLPPREAVWRRHGQGHLFVHAARAASGSAGDGLQPPRPEPTPA
jgi:hypothetical protein